MNLDSQTLERLRSLKAQKNQQIKQQNERRQYEQQVREQQQREQESGEFFAQCMLVLVVGPMLLMPLAFLALIVLFLIKSI